MFTPFDFAIALLGIKSKKFSLSFKNVYTFINMVKDVLIYLMHYLYDGLLCVHHYKRDFLFFKKFLFNVIRKCSLYNN